MKRAGIYLTLLLGIGITSCTTSVDNRKTYHMRRDCLHGKAYMMPYNPDKRPSRGEEYHVQPLPKDSVRMFLDYETRKYIGKNYRDAVCLPYDSSYVDLTMGDVIPTLQDYSISVYYLVTDQNELDGYGHFLFAFSALAENQATEGPYMAMRLNEQRFEVSTGGWENEHIIQQGGKPERNKMHQAIYRQTGTVGELYIDGELIGTNPEMPILSEIFSEAPAYCWIGRAPFHGDKYLTRAVVADFCLYNYSLTDAELQTLLKHKY